MTPDNRYDVLGLPEAQFEPGSGDQVLRNRLGITSKLAMDDAEARALQRATDRFIGTFDANRRFTAADLCEIHRGWLGEIYEWAGRYRQVNVSKGEFPFAAAAQIPALMAAFEQGPLRRHTPCNVTNRADVVRALAEVHTELVLIHPFREGNGRLARLLSTLMALQAGLPLLDFRAIVGENKNVYFSAVQAEVKLMKLMGTDLFSRHHPHRQSDLLSRPSVKGSEKVSTRTRD